MTITHRMSGSSTYKTWLKMRERCGNPKAAQWKWYGGRGIAVCTRWRDSFENFLADMGERPSGKTLDRKDDTKGYELGNCRWATQREQVREQKQTIKVMIDGQSISLMEACERRGLSYMAVYLRIARRGYSIEEAFQLLPRRKREASAANARSAIYGRPA